MKIKFVVLAAILLALGASYFFLPEYAKYCQPNNSKDYYCAALDISAAVGKFVEDHNGAITALATIAIAWFTWTLYRTSQAQGEIALRSIALAREEFVATHRPHIVVYGFDDQGDVDNPHAVQFRYVNKGEARAYVTEIGSALVFSKKDLPPADFTDFKVKTFFPPLEIKSGNDGFKLTEDTVDYIQLLFSDKNGGGLFCIGYIIYRDDNDTSRRTGFCRRYDSDSRRWLKIADDDYEYSY